MSFEDFILKVVLIYPRLFIRISSLRFAFSPDLLNSFADILAWDKNGISRNPNVKCYFIWEFNFS